MTRNDITEKLKNVIEMAVSNTDINIVDCSDSTRLIEDLGLSSVGILYTVIAIEEFFSIRFDDVGFGDFKTVGDVVSYIEKKVS